MGYTSYSRKQSVHDEGMALRSVVSFALCLALSTIPAAAGEGSLPADIAAQTKLRDALAAAGAHARMPDTMYASTPSEGKPYYAHVPSKPAGVHRGDAATGWHKNASDEDTAEAVFRRHISSPVVQAKCVGCHVQGGQSSHTRLVFATSAADEGHVARNYGVFEDFVVAVHNASALILDKIKGVGHGGGVQVAASSPHYAHMRRFLQLLDRETAPAITPETLFDPVRLKTGYKTFYQAALIFAGRVPTEAEQGPWANGTELRAAVRRLMTGPKFHEFLLRGANDRLLTDACCFNLQGTQFVDYVNEQYRLKRDKGLYGWFEGAQFRDRKSVV